MQSKRSNNKTRSSSRPKTRNEPVLNLSNKLSSNVLGRSNCSKNYQYKDLITIYDRAVRHSNRPKTTHKQFAKSKKTQGSMRQCHEKTTMTEPNDHELRQKFDQVIEKLFRILDIFEKGMVSEANITSWVPETALYFLGDVFQRIRVSRHPLSRLEFHNECMKLFRKSCDEDIIEFVGCLNRIHDATQSDLQPASSHHNTTSSHAEHRIIFDQQASFRIAECKKQASEQKSKTIPMCENEQAEKQIMSTTRNSKHPNHPRPLRQKMHQNIQQSRKNHKKLPTPLREYDQFTNVAHKTSDLPRKLNNENLATKGFHVAQSPCFKVDSARDSNPRTGNIHSSPYLNTDFRNYDLPMKYVRDLPIKYSNGLPIKQKNKLIEDSQSRPQKIKTYSDMQKQQSAKLQRLSTRLEDYIKDNALRLERSKQARIELC